MKPNEQAVASSRGDRRYLSRIKMNKRETRRSGANFQPVFALSLFRRLKQLCSELIHSSIVYKYTHEDQYHSIFPVVILYTSAYCNIV